MKKSGGMKKLSKAGGSVKGKVQSLFGAALPMKKG